MPDIKNIQFLGLLFTGLFFTGMSALQMNSAIDFGGTETRGADPGFTIHAWLLDGLPEKTAVEFTRHTSTRTAWRKWGSLDEPTADFSIGIARSEKSGIKRVSARDKMRQLPELNPIPIELDRSSNMMATKFGPVETIFFRTRFQQDTDKQCLGFFGVWNDHKDAVSGWYCAAPGRLPHQSAVRCLINSIEFDGAKTAATLPAEHC